MGLTGHGPVGLIPGPWWALENFTGEVAKTAFVFSTPAGVHIITHGLDPLAPLDGAG
jgi:hypothetical protein